MHAILNNVRVGAVIRDIVEAAVLAVMLFLVLQFAFQNTIVEGSSMEPNFVDREWLLVSKLSYRLSEPRRGDVIVFWAPDQESKEFIKRIVGLPGETVTVRKGTVLIDDRPLDEPWAPILDGTSFGPYRVPDGQYFVLGDNRPKSNDSRTWNGSGGALEGDRIIGKAWLSVWPPETWGLVAGRSPGPAPVVDRP